MGKSPKEALHGASISVDGRDIDSSRRCLELLVSRLVLPIDWPHAHKRHRSGLDTMKRREPGKLAARFRPRKSDIVYTHLCSIPCLPGWIPKRILAFGCPNRTVATQVGTWLSLVERTLGVGEVASSNLVVPTILPILRFGRSCETRGLHGAPTDTARRSHAPSSPQPCRRASPESRCASSPSSRWHRASASRRARTR